MTSILSAFPFIGEQSFATPGAFNSPLSIISANIAAINTDVGAISGVTISPPSGNTIQIPSDLSISGYLSVGKGVSIGTQAPSIAEPVALTIGVNSGISDYLYFNDTSNLRSDYLIGSHAGGTADGLNIFDVSGNTLIVSFSKQSVRFFQQVVGPVFDVGGALADTINAATFGTAADSKEARIQFAVSAASNAVPIISRVYIPANMYPFSGASVSFDTRVQMVREGGDWALYDVIAYGANGGASADSAINAALLGAPHGTPVYCPVITSGYTIADRLSVPSGALLKGDFRGPGLTRWAEVTGLDITTTPGSTFFRVSSVTTSPVALRTNSRVEGIVFWYPNQNWDITAAESFTTYPATILLGDSTLTSPVNPNIWDCHFLGATSCISQYAGDGTAVVSLEVGRCSGVLMGDFLTLRRSTDVTRVFQCHFNPNAATNYVADGSVGGNAQIFRTKAAQRSRVFRLGNVDGLEAMQVFAYGGLNFAYYEPLAYAGDASQGAAGDFTNCNADAFYQVFRVDRGSNQFPLQITSGWYAPLFRPNGLTSDGSNQAFLYLSGISAGNLRINVANARVYGAAVSELSTGWSGSADYFIQASTSSLTNQISVVNAEFHNIVRDVFSPSAATFTALLNCTESDGTQIIRLPYASWGSAGRFSFGTTIAGGIVHIDGAASHVSVAMTTTDGANDRNIELYLRPSGNGNSLAAIDVDDTDTTPSSPSPLLFRMGGTEMGRMTAAGQLQWTAGSAILPAYAISSESSLGLYRSGVSTLAFSYGTVNLATQGVRLSMRTAASLDSTTLAVNEVAFSIQPGSSGASLAIRSGGTIFYFASSNSTKAP